MSYPESVNSFHRAHVDPENLWWQEHAWNDATFSWFTADEHAELRMRALFGGVSLLAGNSIPKIVPSSDWLARAHQANAYSRVDESLFRSNRNLPYSLRLAHYLNREGGERRQDSGSLSRQGAARVIYSIFEFDEDNFEAAMATLPYKVKNSTIQAALLRNSYLPTLAPCGEANERPYGAMLRSALAMAMTDLYADHNSIPNILTSVLANTAATLEDIHVLEAGVDKWLLTAPEPRATEVRRIRNTIYAHPNYPVPTYDEADTTFYNKAFEGCYQNSAMRGYLGLSTGSYSKTEEKRILTKPLPSVGDFYSYELDHHGFILSRLTSRYPASASTLLRLRLKKVVAGDSHDFRFDPGTFRLIGELAPALGSVFSKTAKKVGADVDAIPLEWLEEFI